MALENYRDLSVAGSDFNAGFQFEFYCARCNRKWKSPFKPYRMGQISGLLTRFAFLFSDARTATRTTGNFADMGSRGARNDALAEARVQADTLYTTCGVCKEGVCMDCHDERERSCLSCLCKQRDEAETAQRKQEQRGGGSEAPACPNCRAAMAGGRFCAECGFDMASTHKTCPGCAALTPRQSRFCTDCGHSF